MSGEEQEQGKKAAVKPKVEKPARVEAARGAWAVFDDDNDVIVVESSEIKAFRAAAPFRARVAFWPFGAQQAAVVSGLVPVKR